MTSIAPLSLKALYDLVGAGGLVTEDRPLAIALRPEVAPIVTTAEGPGDALGEMLFHGYRATITTTDDNRVFLELVLDFRTGVGMALVGGGLGFTFDPPAAGDLDATITQNPNKLPEALVDQVFAQLAPQVFGAVQDVLPSSCCPASPGWGWRRSRSAGSGPGSCCSPTWSRPATVRPADRPPPPRPGPTACRALCGGVRLRVRRACRRR